MEMGFLWYSLRKDLARRVADPMALCLWVGIPLLMGGLMSMVGGGGGPLRAELLIVDKDQSFLSRFLVRLAGGAEVVTSELISDEGAAHERMDAGEASALLVIPPDFGRDYLDGRPAELLLITNPAQRILPGIIEVALEILVEGAHYLRRLFGNEIDALIEGPPAGEAFFEAPEVARLAVEINERLRSMGELLFPPVLQLERSQPAEEEHRPDFDMGRAMFPGMLLMSLLFVSMGISDDLWKERSSGALRRLQATPTANRTFLVSKILSGATVISGISSAGLLLGVWVFDLPPARIPVALIWCILAGASLLTLFFCIQTLASTQRGGNVLATMLAFPLMMLGGSFFPYEAMPGWMVRVGAWTPNGQAVLRLGEILSGAALDYVALTGAGALLVGLALVSGALTVKRLGSEG